MVGIMLIVCAFILSLSCTLYYFNTRRRQKMHSKLFGIVLIDIVLSTGIDIVSNVIETYTVATGALFVIQYATQLLFFMIHNMLSPLYTLYTIYLNGVAFRKSRRFFTPSAFLRGIPVLY